MALRADTDSRSFATTISPPPTSGPSLWSFEKERSVDFDVVIPGGTIHIPVEAPPHARDLDKLSAELLSF